MKRHVEIILAICGLLLAMTAIVKLLNGAWMNMVLVFAITIPFLIALFLGLRDWWPFLPLVVQFVPSLLRGVALLDRLTPDIMLTLAVLAFFIGHICIRHKGVPLDEKYARSMFFVSVAITIRFLMNPPGSARVGGSGGIAMAVYYFTAGWSFFSMWWAAENSRLSAKLVVLCLLPVSLFLYLFELRFTRFYEAIYHRSSWIFFPFVLSWLAVCFGQKRGKWQYFHIFSILIMLCTVFNIHRKSLVMGGLVCMTTAWIFRVEKRQFIVLGVAAVIGLGLIVATGKVPRRARRALSTILPSMTITARERSYSGFEDDFREGALKHALVDIAKHPIIGRGFAFSTEDMVALYRSKHATSSDRAAELGIHHYGYISLMTAVGIFVPLFYLYAMVVIVYRFVCLSRGMPTGYAKILASGLIGYFINNLFHWLFNGAGMQMSVLTITLGVMVGLTNKWDQQGYGDDAEELVVDAVQNEDVVKAISYQIPESRVIRPKNRW